MRRTLVEIDNAIAEAEAVRSRHEGVHMIHSCLTVLRLCRSLLENDEWPDVASASFETTLAKVRCIDRTGFRPRSDPYLWEDELPKKSQLADLASASK
jgi:hypothetical protein